MVGDPFVGVGVLQGLGNFHGFLFLWRIGCVVINSLGL
jgi:hypothetical protein